MGGIFNKYANYSNNTYTYIILNKQSISTRNTIYLTASVCNLFFKMKNKESFKKF